MNKVSKDPFGGIKGDATFKTSSPFKIDKEEALKQIQKSINKLTKNKTSVPDWSLNCSARVNPVKPTLALAPGGSFIWP